MTALFLIIMGVVTTVVLGNSEQNQFNSDLVADRPDQADRGRDLTGGYAVVYINLPHQEVGVLTPPSAATAELQAMISDLLANGGARRYFGRRAIRSGPLFSISLPGYPRADRDLAARSPPTEALRTTGPAARRAPASC